MSINDFQIIASSDNNRIKLLTKLSAKKYREAEGKFLVENFVIIRDALKDGYDFSALFLTDEFNLKHEEAVIALCNKSKSKELFLINDKLNKVYSNLDTPSGITAVYDISNKKIDKGSVVYLNGISDPGNLGTILRSALAFGFDNIILDNNCVDIYNPKVIGAAKDAIFKLNIIEDKDGSWLKKNKLPIYTTSSHKGLDLATFKPAKAFCLVLGNESHGVDKEIEKMADKNLKISMSSEIESLNVATAAAILFYELK